MHLRTVFALVVTAGLLAVPASLAAHQSKAVSSANGNVRWTIPLPNAFGVEIGNDLRFKARKHADGTASGRFHYVQVAEGVSSIFDVDVTCMNVYDGNRAKIGGVVKTSNDPTVAVGSFAWFQVFDNGHGHGPPPDRSSLVGFGDETANEAFCNSANLPRFGPWDVHGDIRVRTR